VYKTKRLNIRYFLVCLFFQFSFGIDDTQAWTSIGFEKDFPHSLSLEFEQELRLKDQFSTINQTFSEVTLSYRVFNGLNISIPYRYAVFEDKIKQKKSLSISYKYGIKPISIKYRTKLQRIYEKGENVEELVRNKITIQYKLSKKMEPFFSGEIFHQFNTDDDKFNEYRVSFGMIIDLPKKKSIKLFYIYKKEDLYKIKPDKIIVFGFNFRFNL